MRGQFGGPSSIGQAERARVLILVGLFFVLIIGALGVVFIYTGSTKAAPTTVIVEKEPEVKMVDVLVPVQSIDPGQALEPTMFRREQRPAVGLPSRVVKDFEEIRNQFARSLIVADQPLHRDYMTNVRPTNGLTVKIPDGYRAVTISVDATSSIEGFTRPGARVDVLYITTIRGERAVSNIVQNAQVLSAERQLDNKNPAAGVPSTITLLVTAQDAAKINLARVTGQVTLTLRGDMDPGKVSEGSAGTVMLTDILPKSSQDSPVAQSGPKIMIKNPKTGENEPYILTSDGLKPAGVSKVPER